MENALDKYMEPIFEFGPEFNPDEILKIIPELQLQIFAVFYFSSSLMRSGISSWFLEKQGDNLYDYLIKGLELLEEKEKIEIIYECKKIMLNHSEINRMEMFAKIQETKKEFLDGYIIFEKVKQFIGENHNKFKNLELY